MSSTGMSLNERFTAIATQQEMAVAHNTRSRVRNITHSQVASVDPPASAANRRFLQQLVRKDKMKAALKLKRRSMRAIGNGCTSANIRTNNGLTLARCSVKALRVAANGQPIKTNSLTRVATMKADLVVPIRKRQRHSNSSANFSGLTSDLRAVNGITTKRSLENFQVPIVNATNDWGGRRSRSRSRGRIQMNAGRGRSVSRGRTENVELNVARRYHRSRSHGRMSAAPANGRSVPITARLGVRAGTIPKQSVNAAHAGVTRGRVQKRRSAMIRGKASVIPGGFNTRSRGRSAIRSAPIERNTIKKNRATGAFQPKRKSMKMAIDYTRQGRAQGRKSGGAQAKVRTNAHVQQQRQQQQHRRGRSRSRTRSRRGRDLAKNTTKSGQTSRQQINKEDLDKELDQYMATTKTEDVVDYLLRR